MKIAIIDKNPKAHLTQWRAAPEPKKYFYKDASLEQDIKKYSPDAIFINKANTFTRIPAAVKGYKSFYFYGDFYKPIPEYVKQYAKICTAAIFTNKDKSLWNEIKKSGQKNIYFVSQGVDPNVFYPLGFKKKYDILFAANYFGRKFCGSDIRLEFARFLKKEFGKKFQIIGDGWPADLDAMPRQGAIELNKTINQSKLTVGMSHFIDVPFYTSNRIYQSMATGVPHIAWHSPQVRSIFNQGYIQVKRYSDLKMLLETLLEDTTMRLKIGIRQHAEIINHHTIFHTWVKIQKIMERYCGN